MSNKVLIDIMDENNHDAGTKARNDVTSILNDLQFETTIMFNRTHCNARRFYEVLKATRSISKNTKEKDLILLQYPYQPRIMKLMLHCINNLRKKKGCKLVILIHDVVYLRNEGVISENSDNIKSLEVSFFNAADAVIVHNNAMKKELLSAGVHSPMYELKLFDYVYDGKPAKKALSQKPIIVFAGNLSPEKSGFIYSYKGNGEALFNIYGNNPGELSSSFNYLGSFPPDTLIESLEGNYGLVWDGPSPASCEGNYGNYLRYNNPHKLSLYIAAGLPVIVWSESALANYVIENNLGIAVTSLDKLNHIPKPGSEEYHILLNGVSIIQKRLCKGEMLKAVITRICEEM